MASTWALRELLPEEPLELQALFERCADFFELVHGGPPRDNEAEEQFTVLPRGARYADKSTVGIVDGDDVLIGVAEFVYGWPDEQTVMLGLLLLEPPCRRQGIGTQVLEGLCGTWRAEGFRRVRIGVVAGNASGLRFWERHRFAEIKREPRPRASGGEVLVMVRLLQDP